MEEQVERLGFLRPNTPWIVKELDKLIDEWVSWEAAVAEIVDLPYDVNTQLDVYADGEEMMRKHDILQAKTLTFLNNNISGHGFIKGFDGKGCDRKDLRLKYRVKHRLQRLRVLQASLEYAKVPDSFWAEKGKELVKKLVDKGGDAAVDIAVSYLKNPSGGH